jgi:hypothetical protein
MDAAGWIKLSADPRGCERIEAFFPGHAYEPHRHDTYAIGRTLAGVQQFRYRGATANGLPGTVIVLHPDEPHDGQAGTEAGFHYRMAYLDPASIQQALGGKAPALHSRRRDGRYPPAAGRRHPAGGRGRAGA